MTHKPTDETKLIVEAMAASGRFTQEEMASVISISVPTLKKNYGAIIDISPKLLVARATRRLWDLLDSYDERIRMTTAMFIMKTRGGWRETDSKADESGDTELRPLQITVVEIDEPEAP